MPGIQRFQETGSNSEQKSGTGAESTAFCAENFKLQNEGDPENILAKAEQLARESEELRSFPEVNAYLDAELALCRMMQKICRTLTDGIEMNIPRI